MAPPRSLALVDDPRYREHRGPPGHPERPDRLLAVGEAIAGFRDRARSLAPRPASDEEILRIHDRRHLARVAAAADAAPTHLDPDTFVCPLSLEVARLAAGGAIDAARAVARGEASVGLAAIRPPGHHAESDRAMGFCLFNNVALAARALQAEEGLDRVLVLDWDVHHGNGTQHSFESDPSVLYFSTHQFPFYPGSGDVGEAGIGRGEGTTVNAPLPAGAGDAEIVGVLQRLLVPVARHFRPEAILVSAGSGKVSPPPWARRSPTRRRPCRTRWPRHRAVCSRAWWSARSRFTAAGCRISARPESAPRAGWDAIPPFPPVAGGDGPGSDPLSGHSLRTRPLHLVLEENLCSGFKFFFGNDERCGYNGRRVGLGGMKW